MYRSFFHFCVSYQFLLSLVLGGTHLTTHSMAHLSVLNRYSFYHLYAPPCCFLRLINCVISLMDSYYHRIHMLKITRNLSCVISITYHRINKKSALRQRRRALLMAIYLIFSETYCRFQNTSECGFYFKNTNSSSSQMTLSLKKLPVHVLVSDAPSATKYSACLPVTFLTLPR